MQNKPIGIIAYDCTGKRKIHHVPVFDSYPSDIEFACYYQNLKIDSVTDKIVIALICDDSEENQEHIDITAVCKEFSPIKFCIVRERENYVLYVYCDYWHNGTFKLSSSFLEQAGLAL